MVDRCAECGAEVERGWRPSILATDPERPVCGRCRRKLNTRFAAALAVLGLGVAAAPRLIDMPVWLFTALGGGLAVAAGLVYWWVRGKGKRGKRGKGLLPVALFAFWPFGLQLRPNAKFYVAIFGTWFLSYYVANLACGEWNPLAVGCNDTCKGIMWGSLGSMAALSAAYVMGYRKAIWPMLGVVILQNYPHCQCENGFYIPALRVQPFCMIVPTLVGVTNLWMIRTGLHKPLGLALTLSLLAGGFAVAVTHRLGIPIVWRIFS